MKLPCGVGDVVGLASIIFYNERMNPYEPPTETEPKREQPDKVVRAFLWLPVFFRYRIYWLVRVELHYKRVDDEWDLWLDGESFDLVAVNCRWWE